MQPLLPYLVEPEQMRDYLDHPQVVLIDLSRPHVYAEAHLPGARHLASERLLRGQAPFPGALPTAQQLAAVVASMGIGDDVCDGVHVIAYDDEGGAWAARFLWTLALLGWESCSYLNGGLITWLAEGFPLTSQEPVFAAAVVQSEPIVDMRWLADAEYILTGLNNPDRVLLDARSPDEFYGKQQFALRAGHIPGAVNYEWSRALDESRYMRIRPLDELTEELANLGISADKEVISYCQAHHRSAFTWLLGRLLRFPRVRAYPGSWAEWATLRHAPVVLD